MTKIKIVFFDMEGTIFEKAVQTVKYGISPSLWGAIAVHLGPEAEKEEHLTQDKWNNNEYKGYVEWMEDTIRVHQKYGLDKAFFEKVMSSVDYHKGVKEVFEELKKRGIKTALISGGFKAQADRAQIDLKIDHSFAACEYFWDDKGKLVHWNLLPCDFEGKVDFMHLIMKEHGYTPEECAFVGDGKNDVPFAKEVGTSIAFNAASDLQEVSTYSINQEDKKDFRAILEFI